jgi:monoamine oxidase
MHPDLPVELGAEFVHGKHPALFARIEKFGLQAVPLSGPLYREFNDKLQPINTDDEFFDGILDSPELKRKDIPFSEFIRDIPGNSEQKAGVTSYVEGFNGASADRISTRALYHQQQAENKIEGDSSWRITSGYCALVSHFEERLRESARVLLQSTVHSIEWRNGHVTVTATSQDSTTTATARVVLVTVPLGVLLGQSPASAIVFSPKPAFLNELSLLDPGSALRLNLVFSEPVWEQVAPDASFILSTHERFPTWWPRKSPSAHLLTGWCGGPKAAALAGFSKEVLVQMALTTLSKLLRQEKADLYSKLESTHYHDWRSDPYCAGSYSYVTAGGFEFSQRIGSPIEKTLCFAGEAMACDGHWGTVHGAMESGRRAAAEMLALAWHS